MKKSLSLQKEKRGNRCAQCTALIKMKKTKKKFELGTIDRTFWYGVCVVNALLFPGLCFCFILC